MNENLRINDAFWTIQGEGANAGRRALFIRMPFCNLACTWCDTTFNSFLPWTEDEFRAFCRQEPARFAVLTGGEPMLNRQSPRIIALLKSEGFEIATETNGTMPIMEGIDFATVSPKRFAEGVRDPALGTTGKFRAYTIHPQAWTRASEFKYVVDSEFDFALLDRHNPSDGRRYSLSPEFGDFQANVARILEYVAAHPEWRISLQTHKWMDVK